MNYSNARILSCSVPLVLMAVGASMGVSVPLAKAQGLAPSPAEAPPSDERVAEAAGLMNEAMNLSGQSVAARIAVARGSAPSFRSPLEPRAISWTAHWITINQTSEVPRPVREDAYASFFDVAAHHDPTYAAQVAWELTGCLGARGA